MRIHLTVLVLLAMFATCGCGNREKLVALYGGESSIATVKNATSVKAFRVKSDRFSEALSDYATIAGPVAVSEDVAADLKAVLLDSSVYGWVWEKACGDPEYGVRFQFADSGREVDVLICFKCNHLGVYLKDRAVRFDREGHMAQYADCDDARPRLLAVVKKLFPDDKVIQALE